MTPETISEVSSKIFRRWGHEAGAVESEAELGKLLAISIGLGCLFNENREAEREWMQTPHSAFKTRPITMVLAGKSEEVAAQVLHERGLQIPTYTPRLCPSDG